MHALHGPRSFIFDSLIADFLCRRTFLRHAFAASTQRPCPVLRVGAVPSRQLSKPQACGKRLKRMGGNASTKKWGGDRPKRAELARQAAFADWRTIFIWGWGCAEQMVNVVHGKPPNLELATESSICFSLERIDRCSVVKSIPFYTKRKEWFSPTTYPWVESPQSPLKQIKTVVHLPQHGTIGLHPSHVFLWWFQVCNTPLATPFLASQPPHPTPQRVQHLCLSQWSHWHACAFYVACVQLNF